MEMVTIPKSQAVALSDTYAEFTKGGTPSFNFVQNVKLIRAAGEIVNSIKSERKDGGIVTNNDVDQTTGSGALATAKRQT